MTLTDDQVKALASELDPRRIHQREGGNGKKLSYLATHDAKRTANRIFGYDGWAYVVESLYHIGTETFKNRNGKEGIRVGYRATVTVTAAGARRGDTGYGDAIEYGGSIITPHELAAKEAVSDALKRCLSSFGDQFGLVLYGADPAPAPRAERVEAESKPDYQPPKSILEVSEGDAAKFITKPQQKRLWTIARRDANLSDSVVKDIVVELTGQASTSQIPRHLYDEVISRILGAAA